jgi:hypothetical protein
VVGSELAFETPAELTHVDPRCVALRVHLVEGGGEQDVDAGLLGEPRVALLVARVAVEVLGGPELRRVHEQARDNDVVLFAGGGEQRQVPGVERTHRRDETSPRACPL